MDINAVIAKELGVENWRVDAAVQLLDEGNTVPFIARYRKEKTGTLTDEQLRDLDERLKYLRNLEERKASVIASIEEQGKLTEDLKKRIEAAETLVAVEDLYAPYKQKKRTRAMIAKEKGLLPFAQEIMIAGNNFNLSKEAEKYISEEKEVLTAEDALQGASDIIAEDISDTAEYRAHIRKLTFEKGSLTAAAKDKDAESVYENYYEYSEPIAKVAGYKTLALNRGEKEKFLTVKVEAPADEIRSYLEKNLILSGNTEVNEFLKAAIKDSYDRLLAPAIERDIRNELSENAEDSAITVFGKNLEQLLMQPPVAGRNVLGWDPAFRTGCKLAVVDATGKVLDTAVVYPTAPTNEVKIKAAKEKVKQLIRKYNISLISIGNGTASRESEQIVAEIISELEGKKVSYVITNEAGASVYSASKLATEEFPEFDVGQRSAASIARRVQDPLAELVKIDPKAIGVGQYQHDMNQKKLGERLGAVVEDCVNNVGVDLNTASAPLMEYISGINKTIAKNIVAFREENGAFKNRKELLKVPKLGPKAYEQCAGFMRIANGTDPFDNTGVHPESYEAAEKLLAKCSMSREDIGNKDKVIFIKDYKKTAEEIGVGEPTLRDIIKELERPGRDPRADMPPVVLRSDVLDMKDLKEGMILKGTVRNIVDFGGDNHAALIALAAATVSIVSWSSLSKVFWNLTTSAARLTRIGTRELRTVEFWGAMLRWGVITTLLGFALRLKKGAGSRE